MTRILVIEDEPAILKNVMETLELEGFEVRGAPNGALGVDCARSYLPNLIICDIMMPELNGYDVLMHLRSELSTANIPFMFLTAKADRSDMRKGMELGADDYLVKPFTTSELLAAVDARLARQTIADREVEQKLDELRDNIIRALPHELRTPLTGIIGYAEILLMDFDGIASEQALSMIETIYNSGMRLYRLIENYLLYAQTELALVDPKRRETLRKTPAIPTAQPVTETAARIADKYQRRADLVLTVQDVAICISLDALNKIVEELTDNAFKFSEPGSPVHVTISADGSFVYFIIQDRGRGLTQEQINAIGAYMQFERALYEQQGLGLGLTISKRLAELYAGQLTIESIYGQGTTVYVTLPLR